MCEVQAYGRENPMNWEYKTISFSKRSFLSGKVDPEELNRKLNDQGREGWELVNICNYEMISSPDFIAVFKRQLQVH